MAGRIGVIESNWVDVITRTWGVGKEGRGIKVLALGGLCFPSGSQGVMWACEAKRDKGQRSVDEVVARGIGIVWLSLGYFPM